MATTKLYIRLNDDIADALLRLARTERRHPSDQAAVVLSAVLRGHLSTTVTTTSGVTVPRVP